LVSEANLYTPFTPDRERGVSSLIETRMMGEYNERTPTPRTRGEKREEKKSQ
jgi:hypothetical protein